MSTPRAFTENRNLLLSELLKRAGVVSVGDCAPRDVAINSLADDSRHVKEGSCFVAVRGTSMDGHSFIPSAAAAGAAAIVMDRELEVPDTVARVLVRDSREALARLASAFYGLRADAAGSPRLIGITGTNGKTTVAWLLRSILSTAGRPTALIGTIEYDVLSERRPAPLTTPGALDLCRHVAAARDAGASFGVIEVSSHALDQHRCDGLSFAVGVFTNLSGDHLDYHRTMESYAAAKRRLFDLLDTDAVAVVNRDDPVGADLAKGIRGVPVVSFGLEASDVDVTARVVEATNRESRLLLRARSFERTARFPLIGRHNVLNALAAAAAAEALGIGPDAICEGLSRVAVIPGRLQRADAPGCPFSVLVDYAHTDAALSNVLKALRPVTRGRLICVFGCGGDRDRTKRPRMAAAVGKLADLAYVTSDNPRTEDPLSIIEGILPGFSPSFACHVEVEPDRRRAIQAAITEARRGDTVLIAGKGHETYQLVGDSVLPFDDVAVARECLSVAANEGVA